MSLEFLGPNSDDLEGAPGKHVSETPRLAVWVISVEGLPEELVWCPRSPNGELDRLGHSPSRPSPTPNFLRVLSKRHEKK